MTEERWVKQDQDIFLPLVDTIVTKVIPTVAVRNTSNTNHLKH